MVVISFTCHRFLDGLDRETKSRAFGDFNEDSFLDLAATQENSSELLLYLNNGLGQFSLKDSLKHVASSESIISGDIDGDADLDLVLSNGTVLVNSGKGKFVHGVPLNMNCQRIEFDDVDGDIDLDLVGITENSLLVFMNDGTGIFSMSSKLELEHRPNSLVMGVWDNDGDRDTAIAYDESNIITIFKNDYVSPEQSTSLWSRIFPIPV